jgi:hypothetical protein
MGISATNEEEYANYRKGMPTILQSYGGSFGYDFKVSKVLKAKTDEPIIIGCLLLNSQARK